ncbi:CAP domain-containing protein [Paenibacillus sp. YPG26]|uniref:CAP domain-containing protein n=1 Tax=Paenibacillus sp. YPG26 TaxID=2878915 RepID=UPI00203C493D|nr:CAP domain-containing protein [Paenibacillus sp. YPG26]USB31780.1 CAP domain-containing protein [Paenibacillus sp. YPG26]
MKLQKNLVTGALALSLFAVTGAASASAAADTTTENYNKVWSYSTNQSFSWSHVLQQLRTMNNQASAATKAQGTTGNQASQKTKSNTHTTQNNTNTAKTGTSESAYADQVVALVNQERAKAGVKPLAADKALTVMALDKAKDMYNNGYFDHNSPTYGSPFDMMKSYGIRYTYAGENIAKGQKNPAEVMKAWMNSPGHKQNILSPNFTKIGAAYYNGEWVQEFIAD